MPSLHVFSVLVAFIAICGFTLFPSASAVSSYCSSINTSNGQRNSSIYQSDGLCGDFCRPSAAFAVVQYDSCWCSDYMPSSVVSIDNCDTTCPGYPYELCGGTDLFGYIALTKAVAGTKGSGSAQSTTSSRSQTSGTTSATSMTWTPTPVVSVVTVTGQVQTITYTPTTPPDSSANQSDLRQGGSNALNTGQAVGLTFGLVALVVLISAGVFFCVRKRNKQKRKEAEVEAAASASAFSRSGSSQVGHIPQRTMSENSRFMLQTDGRQVVEGWETNDSGTPGSRVSRLLPVDPRLDPYAGVYQRGDGSKSRESFQTIQDNHDYSRRVLGQGPILRATNPD